MTKDFRVKVGVRNNVLLECIERAGHVMGPTFCRAAKVNYDHVGALAAMRLSPIKDGDWHPTVRKLSAFLDVSPEEMFRTCHVEPLKKSSVERKADAQEVFDLLNAPEPDEPSTLLENKETSTAIDAAIDLLLPRERLIVERHTMGAETYDELAAVLDISRERVRQIEGHALKKLRRNGALQEV